MHIRLHEEFHTHDSASEEDLPEEETLLEKHPLRHDHLDDQDDGFDKEAFERYLEEQDDEVVSCGVSDMGETRRHVLEDALLQMSKLSASEVPIAAVPDVGLLPVFNDMDTYADAFKDPSTEIPEHFTGTEDFRNWQGMTHEMKVSQCVSLCIIFYIILTSYTMAFVA